MLVGVIRKWTQR